MFTEEFRLINTSGSGAVTLEEFKKFFKYVCKVVKILFYFIIIIYCYYFYNYYYLV
jgi:hypothetical protein